MSFDPGFRAARKAGTRGLSGVILPLLFLGFLAFFFQAIVGDVRDGLDAPWMLFVVWVFMAGVGVAMLVTQLRRLVRSRAAWSRAGRGAVSLTLPGVAVARARTVAGRPMRTVVVRHRGEERYLHLLFAQGARTGDLGPGSVTVEFFDGDEPEGPARLLPAGGRTLWAFTSRLGRRTPAELRGETRHRPGRATDDGGAQVATAGAAGTAAYPGDLARPHQRTPGDAPDDQEIPGDGIPGDGVPSDGWSGSGRDDVWSGSDGWSGGGSWGGDPTWSGSDGGAGWSGGDSGGWGGGDSGGGSDSGGGGGS